MPPAHATSVERATSLAALRAQAPAWHELAERVAPQPFATWPWIRAHVVHRLGPEGFSCHLARHGDTLVGVLPLHRRGRTLRVPADFHTRDGDVLLAPDGGPEVLTALLDHAEATEPAYTALEMGGVLPSSTTVAALEGLPARRFVCPDLTGCSIRLDAPWSTWREQLSRSFRRTLRRGGKRARRDGWAFRGLDGEVGDPSFFTTFTDLEASGWKGRSGNPINARERDCTFWYAFVEGLADAGWLRWHRLEIDGRLAAAHLAAQIGGRLTLVKIAYDEAFARRGPGTLLLDAVLESASADPGIQTLDCITDVPWQKRWHMDRHTYHAVRFHPRSARAFLTGTVPSLLRSAARRVRRRESVASEVR